MTRIVQFWSFDPIRHQPLLASLPKQIAIQIGHNQSFRAVGMANNRNPIVIVVPCHRVIGYDGKLTGYAGGLDVKEQLLALEKR